MGGDGRRWQQAVGGRAQTIAPAFGEHWFVFLATANLHDLGYGPELDTTGLHLPYGTDTSAGAG